MTLALLLPGCAALQEAAPKPSARITGMRLAGLGLQKADLVFDVEISNPYAFALPLLDLTYALGSGGSRFLEGSLKPQQSIPARGRGTVELPAAVHFSSLMRLVQRVQPGSVLPYTVDVTATVDAPLLGRLVVPVSRNGELPIPALPAIELAQLRVESISLDQVRTLLRLNVTNTNRFALGASNMAVNLSLGGKAVGSSSLRQPVHLEAGKSAALEIPLTFSPRAAGVAVVNLLRGNQASYGISGTMEADTPFGRVRMPFQSSGNSPISR